MEQPGVAALALVAGATPSRVESALFEQMLVGWRRQQLSRRLGGSLIDGRERTLRRFQSFADDWPWSWRAEDLERWVAGSSWAHSTVRNYQVAVAAFCGYVTDPRYGWVAECEQRVGARPSQICHEDNTAAHVGRSRSAAAGALPGLAGHRGHRARRKGGCLTAVSMFFHAIRQHGWDETLPTTAVVFTGDTPRRPPRLSRRLAEHVMAQVESPTNLDRWPHPQGRLLTLILIRCGLRASDACTLGFDCLVHDGQDAPYLRYVNHKMRREAAVPIDDELEAEIRCQQQAAAARWPQSHPHLFPALAGNANGERALTYYSHRAMLIRWLADCDIRDEHGHPARLTPHQWRHTSHLRLPADQPRRPPRSRPGAAGPRVDRDDRALPADHRPDPAPTVGAATKVNIKGERVSLDPNGPLAQAQWAKTRYGIATQTLPHRSFH